MGFISLFAVQLTAFAQNNDPVIMTIAGEPVLRSEFEYSYNKNNTEGVIDKKTIEEYVDLFINYKLKVAAALGEKMDTMTSYQKEYVGYRDQQVRPTLINEADVEAEARKIYNDTKNRVGTDGLITPAHILLRLPQQAGNDEQIRVKNRADSIYKNGGNIGQISRGQTLKEFEDVAFSLRDGQVSRPFLSPAGYHIVKMLGHAPMPSYDSLRADIHRFIDARGIRESIINGKLEQMVKATGLPQEQIMNQRADSLASLDSDMKYLFKEYHDGLLLYEISNREVWEKASKDEEGLNAYFKKNKKKYTWDAPRFKGIAYHARSIDDVMEVRKVLKGKPFDEWAEILRSTFNSDSVLRIRVEKGIFKMGDNALVDKDVFGLEATPKKMKDYPYDATFGDVLKAPKEMGDVRAQVVADYQEALEQGWIAVLRERFPVEVNKEVLATVNKH